MMENKKLKRALWILKLFLVAVMAYGWIWGHWSIQNYMDVLVTLIGLVALLFIW